MKHPLKWVEISEERVLHNAQEAKRCLNGQTELAAVVKANAYGHGMELTASILDSRNAVDAFAVFDVPEAEKLRAAGIKRKILILGYITPDDCEAVAELELTPFIYSTEILDPLNSAAEKNSRKIRVLIKADTGMGRLGVKQTTLPAILELTKNTPFVEPAGFATHFACSDDESREKTDSQSARFRKLVDEHKSLLAPPLQNCAANTGGILLYPETHYDIVRFGIGLYGFYPSEFVRKTSSASLKPVLEYKTRIIHIQKLQKGNSVSYGSTWTAEKDTTIAVLPVGYADGYIRAFSNRAHVLVNGRKAPVRGRVCMDMTMVDITGIENVHPGTEATVISSDTDSGCTADDLAKLADTINYEITTIIPPNIPRFSDSVMQ